MLISRGGSDPRSTGKVPWLPGQEATARPSLVGSGGGMSPTMGAGIGAGGAVTGPACSGRF